MTIRQVAGYLQMGHATTYQLTNKGKLPGRKVGGMWWLKKSEVDEWLAGNSRPIPLNILVIEDEKPSCGFFVKVLAPKGRAVRTAHSGEDALSTLSAPQLELVFLVLPGLCGIGIYHKVCKLSHPPEVIVITSVAPSHSFIKVLEIGLLPIIQKLSRPESFSKQPEKAAGNTISMYESS